MAGVLEPYQRRSGQLGEVTQLSEQSSPFVQAFSAGALRQGGQLTADKLWDHRSIEPVLANEPPRFVQLSLEPLEAELCLVVMERLLESLLVSRAYAVAELRVPCLEGRGAL